MQTLLIYCLFLFSFAPSEGFTAIARRYSDRYSFCVFCKQQRQNQDSSVYSSGLQELIEHLNNDISDPVVDDFTRALALDDAVLDEEARKANFWMGGSFKIQKVQIKNVFETHMELKATVNVKGKIQIRDKIKVPFPSPIRDETDLKRVLINMAYDKNKIQQTANIARLRFGENFSMPSNFRWNDVPHEKWVRSYLYTAASNAFSKAITDPTIATKSKLQIKVNFPEVNPAFDTYRLGTILEMVRDIALSQAYEGKNVRICVQQPLGEGIFVGLPLALASMRKVMERMDWGKQMNQQLNEKDAFLKKQTDEGKHKDAAAAATVDIPSTFPMKDTQIRFGAIAADEVADDDDCFIVVAPQNVVGACIIEYLEEMIKKVDGRPLVLINPILADRPSSNNVMQVRGRAERRAFEDSFQDIYVMKLLYPSSGGYMFPIRGLVVKQDYQSPYLLYSKNEVGENKDEVYEILAAFPPHPQPDPSKISNVFTQRA